MWLNAFQKGEKSLSPIELLILAMVPEDFSSPKLITEILVEKTQEWIPTSGTVYPILHRLEGRGLLEKTGKSRLQFRKSAGGKIFLSTLLKPLQAQTRESNQFYLTIIKSILEVSPMPIGLKEFMETHKE